jgi:hypothetical protein
LDDRMVNTRNG